MVNLSDIGTKLKHIFIKYFLFYLNIFFTVESFSGNLLNPHCVNITIYTINIILELCKKNILLKCSWVFYTNVLKSKNCYKL